MFAKEWSAGVLGTIVALALTAQGLAHPGHGGTEPAPQRKQYGGGSSEPDKPRPPEPYNGQVCCPVTGAKLGSMGPPVPVETGIGAKQPTVWGKLFGQKPTDGLMIYVCCQDCAAQVKSDPVPYVTKVINERGQGRGGSDPSGASRSAVQPSRWDRSGTPAYVPADRPKGSC
jgi:hypothetical protein